MRVLLLLFHASRTQCTILTCSWMVLSLATPAHAVQPAFIKGTIYNAYNTSIVRSATIITTNGLSVSASSGQFVLRVPPNFYDLIVTSPGYRSNMVSGVLAAPGQTTVLNVWLSPSSTDTVYLKGRVLALSTAEPIHEAFIATDLGGVALSDENGFFKMICPTGTANVTAAAEGFSTKIVKNIPVDPDGNNMVVMYLKDAPDSTVTLTGSAIDACTGSAAVNVRVLSPSGEIDFSGNGSWKLSVPTGLTTILASAPEFQFSYKTISLTKLPAQRMLNIGMYDLDSGIGLIRGTVTHSQTGEPLPDVRLETDTGSISFSASDSGTYKIYTSLCTSTVYAVKEGFQPAAVTMSFASRTSTRLDISLIPLAVISGIVSDGTDQHPVREALVFIREKPDISTTTAQDGSYFLASVPPGVYTLETAHRCFTPQLLLLTVDPGDDVVHDFSLEAYGRGILQGFVHDALFGEPVAGATVSADHGSLTVTDDSGFYSLHMPACRASVHAEAAGYRSSRYQSVMIEDEAVTELDVTLVPRLFTLTFSDSVSGSVPDGCPAVSRRYRDDR